MRKLRISHHDLKRGGRSIWELFDEAFERFTDGGGMTVGAAVAFYALMSAAPLLVVSVTIAGVVFGDATARHAIVSRISENLGADTASVLQRLMAASRPSTESGLATLFSILVLLWAAGRLFVQIQEGLNAIWGVRRRSAQQLRRKLGNLIRKRLVSFFMVALCGVALGLVLAMQAALSVADNVLQDFMSLDPVWYLLELVVTFGALGALFAALYRVLPDARLAWRDTWIGAMFTAAAIALGIWAIGLYIGHVSIESTYGAAGSIVLLVFWVYYSSQIFFFGAAFTRAWATQHGQGVRPEPHATRVLSEEELDATGS